MLDDTYLTTRRSVTLTREAALAFVTLSQAGRGNPVDAQLVAELHELSVELEQDESVRAVLLRAEGAHFCRPSDASGRYDGLNHLGPDALDHRRVFDAALTRLWMLPVPVLVSVQGHALGDGCGLVVAGDLVLAGESARFGAPTALVSLPGELGTAVRLAQRMGVAKARRFCLLRETISAREAHSSGLVDRMIPDEDLERKVLDQARRLAAAPARDCAAVKARYARMLPSAVEAVTDAACGDPESLAGLRDVAGDVRALVHRRRSTVDDG